MKTAQGCRVKEAGNEWYEVASLPEGFGTDRETGM